MLIKSHSMQDMQRLFGYSRSGMRKVIVKIENDPQLSPLLVKRQIAYFTGKNATQKRFRHEYVIDETLVKQIANRSLKPNAIIIQDNLNTVQQPPNDRMITFLVNQLQKHTRNFTEVNAEFDNIKQEWVKIKEWGDDLKYLLQSFHALKEAEMENPNIRHKWEQLHYAEQIEKIETFHLEGEKYIFALFKQASPALIYIRANSAINESQFRGKILPKWGEIGKRFKENKSKPDSIGVITAFGQSKPKHYTVVDECYADYYEYVHRLRTIHANRQMEYEPEKNIYAAQ